MTEPAAPRPEPGERPPAPTGARLERAPSERYRRPGAPSGSGAVTPAASAAGPITAAACVAIVGAGVLTFILGVILAPTGTFVVSLLAGVAIGLIVSGAAAGPNAPLNRDTAIRIAVGLALGMAILTGLGTWVLARAEGGVMDPVSYLWTTFGFGIPAQAIIAVLAAAWGAASGPIRWRD